MSAVRSAQSPSFGSAGTSVIHHLRRWWWLALLVAAVGCRAELDIVVTVNEDGSGLVSTITTIDDETTDGLLDLDATGLLLGDLAQSGWDVGRPERTASGATVVEASKAFGTADQFGEVMNDLTGPDGPIRDFRLTRTKSFARVDYAVEGVIDTTVDLSSFSDPDLETMLGRTLQDIADRYGATEEQVDFRVEVVLPGDLQGEAPTGLLDSEPEQLRAEWRASLSDDDLTEVALTTATRQVSALVLRGVAVVAGVLAALVLFAQVLRILLPDRTRLPRRRSAERKERAQGEDKPPEPEPATEQEAVVADEETPAVSPHRVIALDGMGVLYREPNDIHALLVPFVRERGSTAMSEEEIAAKARALSLGRMTTGQFWAAVGVEGEANDLDAAYLSRHQLTPGVIKYLRTLRDNGVRAACITNDAAAWAMALKSNHSLEGLVDPWVVSGSVGVRKPDKPIFEVLRRVTGEPPSSILVIDDDLDILDAARELGFATAWFSPDGSRADAREHSLIRNFDASTDEEPAESDTVARAEGPR